MKKRAIIIIIAAIVVFLGIGIYNLGINDETIIGNNLSTCNYARGVKEDYYSSIDDAIADIVPTEKEIIYEIQDNNVFFVFALEDGTVSGYEFLDRKSRHYEFVGEKKIQFVTDLEQEEYSWEKTLKADLSLSLQKTYRNTTEFGEDYSVLPSWGISKFSEISDVCIEGISMDAVKRFEYDGENYYLWFINDVSSIDSLSEAEIAVN